MPKLSNFNNFCNGVSLFSGFDRSINFGIQLKSVVLISSSYKVIPIASGLV